MWVNCHYFSFGIYTVKYLYCSCIKWLLNWLNYFAVAGQLKIIPSTAHIGNVGEAVVFRCFTDNAVKWYHVRKEPGEAILISQKHNLTFHHIQLSHGGSYYCSTQIPGFPELFLAISALLVKGKYSEVVLVRNIILSKTVNACTQACYIYT